MNFFWKLSTHISDWFVAEGSRSSCDVDGEIQLLSLEPRILYSASPVPIELVDVAQQDPHTIDATLDLISEAIDSIDDANSDSTAEKVDFGSLNSTVEHRLDFNQQFALVIIDKSIDGYELMLEDILSQQQASTVVRFIDSSVDGFHELGRHLGNGVAQGKSWSSVHVVAHGDEGQLQLGSATVDINSIDEYSEEITSWRDMLGQSADILLYGCNLAGSDEGQDLVERISRLSGADVAASDDVTGHEDFGGNWELEYTAGEIDTDIVFSAALQQAWQSSLQATLGDESGTSHKSVGSDFNGNKTIAYSSDDSGSWLVHVSRYSNLDSSVPLKLFDGTDFENIQVNNNDGLSGDHRHAVVGSSANGNFAVAWTWYDGVGGSKVYAKLYDHEGNVVRDQFQVDANGANGHNATIAMNQSGQFVIGWEQDDAVSDDVLFSIFDSSGTVVDNRQAIDASMADNQHDLVVSINDNGTSAFAFKGNDANEVYVRAYDAGTFSNTYSYSQSNVNSIRDVTVDVNNQGLIGLAFVADVGPFGAENQDIFAQILEFDDVSDSITNVTPSETFGSGFSSYSVNLIAIAGADANLEYFPSIAIEDTVDDAGTFRTEFHVTWQGHGSWQNNLDDGLVHNGGSTVSSSTSFPGGNVEASNGVFINSVVYSSDGSTTKTGEYSLQNELSDFDSDAKFASVVAYRDRSEFAFVFESASGIAQTDSNIVDQTPEATDSEAVGVENLDLVFSASDFGYHDSESAALAAIRIDSLPTLGTLLLNGVALTQTDVDGILVISAADISTLSFSPPLETRGRNLDSFQFSVNDGSLWSQSSATLSITLDAEDRIWVSTEATPDGASGIPGDGSESLQFGGPDLAFGPSTIGDWSAQFGQAGVDLIALHFVTQTVTIGSGTVLNAGDILFTTKFAIPAGPIESTDIVRFRPTSADYTTGTYETIARVSLFQSVLPIDYQINAISLVEQDSIIGDSVLSAGDILLVDSADGDAIYRLELSQTGETSVGNFTLLVDGSEAGINGDIDGIEFIESSTTVGGVTLSAGSLLVSTDIADSVGSDNTLAVESQDIFVLDIETTTATSGATLASATMFLDGSEVGANPTDSNSNIDAVALLGNADAAATLVANPTTIDIDEDTVYRFESTDFVSVSTEPNLEHIVFTNLPNVANGQLFLRGESVVADQVILVDDLAFLTYVPTGNASFPSDSLSYRAASSGEIIAEATINIQVDALPDDLLIGSGATLEERFENDFVVNSSTSEDQNQQKVASLTDGGYVIVWRSVTSTGYEILFQRYDANHSKVGIEHSLDGASLNPKSLPEVVGLSDGGFVVTASVSNGTDVDIVAARFNAAGQQVDLNTGVGTGAVVIVAGGSGNQRASSIAALQDGGFVITWTDISTDSVKAKVIHGSFENEIDLSGTTAATQYRDVVVTSLNQGGFAAVWRRVTASDSSIELGYFDINGQQVGSTASLAATNDVSSFLTTDTLANGNIVAAWTEDSGGDPGGSHQIVSAIVDSSGSVLPPGEKVVAYANDGTTIPNVVAMPDGGFMLNFGDQEIDSTGRSIAAVRFDAEFNELAPFEVLNAQTSDAQYSPDAAVLEGSNEVVAVWSTNTSGDADVVANIFRNAATAEYGQRVTLDLNALVTSGSSDHITNVEINGLPAGTRLFGTMTSTGSASEIFGPPFNLNSFDLDTIELEFPNFVDKVEYSLDVNFEDNGITRSVSQTMVAKAQGQSTTLSGTIFNDEEADGLTDGNSGFEDVSVILFEDTGSGYVQVATDTTDASGRYEFLGLGTGTYFVAVDSTTIGAGLTSDLLNEDRIWAEQTWGSTGSITTDLNVGSSTSQFMFGGRNATVSDDASSLSTAEHVNRQQIGTGVLDISNVDFAFSFNAVVNIEDQFDSGNPDARTAQGSLRQFIQNANLVDGPNVMKFVPIVAANQSTDLDADAATIEQWWRLDVAAALPQIRSSQTVLDGQAWTPTETGLVELDQNAFNVGSSYLGDVGNQGSTFSGIDAPELEILGNSSMTHGFEVVADSSNEVVSDVVIRNFSIQGFGDDAAFASAIAVHGESDLDPLVSLDRVTISNNVIGASPNDMNSGVITRPSTDQFRGISVSGATNGLISGNIIVSNSDGGIILQDAKGDVSGWSIIDNEIANNGSFNGTGDGISAVDVSSIGILRNAIHGNHGMGIEQTAFNASISGWMIEENSIFANGMGTDLEGSGIRVSSANNQIRYNTITQNQYDGVTVTGFLDTGNNRFVASSGNLVSQNSFGENGQLSIDLFVDAFGGESFADLDGDASGFIDSGEANVTLQQYFPSIASLITNDSLISQAEADLYYKQNVNSADELNALGSVANASVANNGLEAPAIGTAEFDAGQFLITFTSIDAATDRIELYATSSANLDPAGEGVRYFSTVNVADMTDLGGGSYLATLSASDFPADVDRSTPITSIAIDSSNNTSEFASNVTPTIASNVAPQANNSVVNINEDQSPHYAFSLSDFSYTDVDLDPVNEIIVSDMSSLDGHLELSGSIVSSGQRIAATEINAGNLVFVPTGNFFGTTSFDFAVNDSDLDSNIATMTVNVASINDAPSGTSSTLTTFEDDPFQLSASSFGFSDTIDGNTLESVRIVAVSGSGTLQLAGVAVSDGSLVSATQFGDLQFVPNLNQSGTNLARPGHFSSHR